MNNGFVRHVGVLVGGAAFSQVLTILALPILTRIYTPEDFSLLALYSSLLGLISVAACLRFEIAIPIPDNDEDSINLLALAIFSLFSIVIILTGGIYFFHAEIESLISDKRLSEYLWLLPVGVLVSGLYQTWQYWSTRKRKFKLIAKTRLVQSISGVGTQVGFGLAGLSPLGLLLGQMFSSGAGFIGLAKNAIQSDKSVLGKISIIRMKDNFVAYKHYPKYSTLEAITNTGGLQIPIIIIATLAAGAEVGFVMLAIKVMAAPMGLIGGAVSQVYLSHAPDKMREGELAEFTLNVINGLFRVGVGPLLFAGVAAPALFSVVFGEGWDRAGEIVSWMTPWFIMQFVSSPISMSLHITNNQKYALLLQVFGLCIRVGAVLICYWFYKHGIVEAFAISGFLFYTIYLILLLKICNISVLSFLNVTIKNIFIFLFWIVLGVGVVVLHNFLLDL